MARAPVSTLRKILLTPEDLEDLKSVQPFVLTTTELPKYLIRYLGKETLDEIPMLRVCRKAQESRRRASVTSRGSSGWTTATCRSSRATGAAPAFSRKGNAYPKFETYREQIDGKYWFPTYTIANATLHFPEFDQRIKQTVRYEDYKQFKATTTITFGDEVEQPKKPRPNQTGQKTIRRPRRRPSDLRTWFGYGPGSYGKPLNFAQRSAEITTWHGCPRSSNRRVAGRGETVLELACVCNRPQAEPTRSSIRSRASSWPA